jgi:TPR repeat protein
MQTSRTKSRFVSAYNPANQTPEELVSNYVIRLDEFNELFQAVKGDSMDKPPQHYIIQGQRGYGKTTLLLRLAIEINNHESLRKWLIPIVFDEEQYAIHTLAGLWEEVADMLGHEDASFLHLSEKIEAAYKSNDNPEEEIYAVLTEALNQQGKKLIILLDNFGDIIKKFTNKENQRLREVLLTSNCVRLIGASAVILESYYRYEEPLFDFFKVITLDELDREETIRLLVRLGETHQAAEIDKIIKEQPERIDALRKLTGGVPRTIILLFEIFTDDVDGNSFKDMEMTLDRVTPLYKHRLDSLPTQQQAILDAIAQAWDAVSVKEIAAKARMASKAVSAQLNQLEKSQIIQKIPTSKKNHLYQIRERFFNIYYLMRLGKKRNRNKVLWLVKFFEICCGVAELAERARRHIRAMQEDRLYERHAFYVAYALAKTKGLDADLQHELIAETRNYLSARKSDLVKDLEKSRLEVVEEFFEDPENGDAAVIREALTDAGMPLPFVNGLIAEVKKDFQQAITLYKEAVAQGNAKAMFTLAFLYENEFKDFLQAETYYRMAVEQGDADAMNNLALLYENAFKDFAQAETYYRMAVEKGDAEAMFNLALLYKKEFKDFMQAETYYRMAIEKGHTKAMNNLALLYANELKDFAQAETYYRMAVEKGDANAMFNLALLYANELKDFAQAETYYRMAVEKEHTGAMNNLGLLYRKEFKDFSQAETYFRMAVEQSDAKAMFNLALLYDNDFKDFVQAETYYRMAVEQGDADAMNNLAVLYENELKDFVQAETYFRMAVEQGNADAMNNLAHHYFEDRKNRQEALLLQKKAYEIGKDSNKAYGYIIVLLWNDEIEAAVNIYHDCFDKEETQKDVSPAIKDILISFIAKGQYSFVYRLFKDNKYEIKDKYKPVYYALLTLMGEKYADEQKRMGAELKETVQEIIGQIKAMTDRLA